jgi:hypothetical protein
VIGGPAGVALALLVITGLGVALGSLIANAAMHYGEDDE